MRAKKGEKPKREKGKKEKIKRMCICICVAVIRRSAPRNYVLNSHPHEIVSMCVYVEKNIVTIGILSIVTIFFSMCIYAC